MKTRKRHRRHRWRRYSKHSLTLKKRRRRKKKQKGGGWGSLGGSFTKKIGTLKSKFSSLTKKIKTASPEISKLPKQFGSLLDKGTKFTGDLPIPASLNKSANIENTSMGIPNTIPAKLEPSNLSNELILQNERMDELTKKMDILFEK